MTSILPTSFVSHSIEKCDIFFLFFFLFDNGICKLNYFFIFFISFFLYHNIYIIFIFIFCITKCLTSNHTYLELEKKYYMRINEAMLNNHFSKSRYIVHSNTWQNRDGQLRHFLSHERFIGRMIPSGIEIAITNRFDYHSVGEPLIEGQYPRLIGATIGRKRGIHT